MLAASPSRTPRSSPYGTKRRAPIWSIEQVQPEGSKRLVTADPISGWLSRPSSTYEGWWGSSAYLCGCHIQHIPIYPNVFLVVSQLLIGPQFNPILSFEMQARSLHLRTQNRKLSQSEVATIWGSEPPIWNWPVTCGCGWFLQDWKWHLTLAETVCFDGFRTSCVGLIVLQLPASVHWHLWDWPCHECDMNSEAKADGKLTPLQWYSENKAPNRKKLFTLQETWLYVCCLLFKKKYVFLKIPEDFSQSGNQNA